MEWASREEVIGVNVHAQRAQTQTKNPKERKNKEVVVEHIEENIKSQNPCIFN